MNTPLVIYLDVPFVTFREFHAREMGRTYPVPPPATVYGMLLSLVGETDVYRHCGVELAIAMLSEAKKSRILRQMRRFKQKDFSHAENVNPSYQEILSNLKCLIWVRSEAEMMQPSLKERIEFTFERPELVRRFGCLFLGESDQLIKTIRLVSEDYREGVRRWLIRDNGGRLTLPYWVDHLGSRNTRFLRYRVEEMNQLSPPDFAWTSIQSSV
ncbi:CRISPR-associated protein DevS [Rippkaea orientalis PCC 8801]|uniref:CRISPR-associated protein DevS n=1 Tax=Rippkaea orientalis (strain PCC 8801 / RF-1) TaxID=41431 RepID=B7JW17_RIPO1|nr:type I-MYXAN CRISPR-associated protein Cas5/Cmx5/DevS [Rippkaea orientalis]ACK65706.1 CRISPR-associated protein DevS [Rippkaea orientalis PCC 8801]